MTTKPAPKKQPAKKQASTALSTVKAAPLPANYEEKTAADIDAFRKRLAVADTNKIGVTQDKHFTLPSPGGGDPVKVKTVTGIVIDFCAHKRWYENAYVKGENVPPTCFAIGFNPHDNLLPSENSPEAQAEDCRNCAKNKFVQQANGKWLPKDCKDSYMLALLAPDDNGEGKLMTLSISSTGVRDFDKYVRQQAAVGLAPYQIVTEFSFDPKHDFPSIRPTMIDKVPKNAMGLVMNVVNNGTAIDMVLREPLIDDFESKVAAKRLAAPKGKGRKAA